MGDSPRHPVRPPGTNLRVCPSSRRCPIPARQVSHGILIRARARPCTKPHPHLRAFLCVWVYACAMGLWVRVCARLWFEWQFTGCIVADCGLMRARNEADMRNMTPACVRPRVRTRPMCAVVRTCITCLLRAFVWRLCEAATNGTTCGTSSFAHTARRAQMPSADTGRAPVAP